ncbi:MAG: NAD-dependent DNA ligase LigA [Saprospiraceae bacterium]|nr:NAD-dependent DNA ligase LigA [Saprospiraceae bacterium]
MYPPEFQKDLIEKSKQFLLVPATINDLKGLRELLIFHEYKYYIEDDPLISDFEYDLLYKQLVNIEEKHPELITIDSPTQRVSVDLSRDATSVQHTVPMLSLDNSYNEDDLNSFDASVKKLCGLPADTNIEYCVEPKFDGGSIALLYENDILVRAATRGNGVYGEEMTPNAKSMPSIPLKALFSSKGIVKVELRGEALIRKDRFEKMNKEREKEGLPLFANPRNAATGGLRTKDANETRKRGLEAFIYQIAYAEDIIGESILPKLKTHFSGIELLGSLGFKIPHEEKKVCKNITEVHNFVQLWAIKRDDFGYEIDGMVIKVNNLAIQERCGFTAHHPRWAMAFKFKAKQATSTLLAIEYQVGKIGSITPVAKIKPVHLAGVTVSSISLHNEDFIRGKDLRIGDSILVERAGDVIPYIVKSFPELRSGKEEIIHFPQLCPINSTSTPIMLIKEEGESAWRCPTCVCGMQDLQKMIFHVSKDAMDIDGFGKSYVERFFENGWLKDMSDLYNLNYKDIEKLEGFGQRSADKLRESVEQAKRNPIQRLLYALCIHHFGKKASKLVAERINHVLDLKDWKLEQYLEIKDIGPVVAENVMAWFSNESNIKMLQRMEIYGVNLTQTEEDKPLLISEDGILYGKTILFTGTLMAMGRKEAEELASKHGAKNISAVSSNLNILVVGENAGSKLKKAQSLGTVQILTEDEFVSMING